MQRVAENEIVKVYHQLLECWNQRNARAMADLFTDDGESIGFDGSMETGKESIYRHLAPIFVDHPTPRYVGKVKGIRFLGPDIAVVRAIAGMVPDKQTNIHPDLNTHHTLILVNQDGDWRILLFQNTPAQFHGRPELVEQMTDELQELL